MVPALIPPLTAPLALATTVAALRSGSLSLPELIEEVCARMGAVEPQVRAVLPERGRRERLLREAEALARRYPDPGGRPVLFGALVGVKDIFAVEGFEMRAGSALPPELFAGDEAESVRRLRAAGALVLGKTVCTEFAFFDPGATANPHNPAHTPGGSSSGSAAAVAAGIAALALGSQTVGSVIRPASFCGVVGVKPSYGRIPYDGVLYFSESMDHVGFFTQDAAGAALAASVLLDGWRTPAEQPGERLPTLGVPEGPYLELAEPETLRAFERQVERLESKGCAVKRVPAFAEIDAMQVRHRALIAAEFAEVHAEWFRDYGPLYRSTSAMLMDEGRGVSAETVAEARESRTRVRAELEALMAEHGIDLWVCPSTTGPAPEGLGATGNPAMNLPWTHSGLPTVTLPAGTSEVGLPLGLQIAGRFMADELALVDAQTLETLL